MLYLLYLRNGFIKKVPLSKKNTSLGRSISNDLQLDEVFVSKEHAKIVMKQDSIEIFDLNSTNGVFSKKGKIKNEIINLNQYFRIGHIKFYLKMGNAKEFIISEKIQPKLNRAFNQQIVNNDKTIEVVNHLFSEQLAEILNIGFGLPDISNILELSKDLLQNTIGTGTLLLLSREKNNNKIVSQWNDSWGTKKIIDKILKKIPIYDKQFSNTRTESDHYICSYPIHLNKIPSALLYLTSSDEKIPEHISEFIEILSIEISTIDSLIKQNKETNSENDPKYQKIISINSDLNNLIAQSKKIAGSNLSILIEGETGTGKELLAKFIHYNSTNDKDKFIALNCSAIPENLMEAELFGHEKGAFTDASMQRKGKLELASGGTLILDEIGDMPLNLQAKLLRAIQEEQFYRLGGTVPIKVKLRIISITNKNISELIEQDTFRQDLYYRIAHIALKIPPLRDRKEDIIPLLNHLIEKHSKSINTNIKGFCNETIKALEMYNWPGNIRELENELIKLLTLAENNDIIDFNMLKHEIKDSYEKSDPENSGASNEKKTILDLLDSNKWNKSIVADKMKISRTALYNKLKKHSITL